MKPTAFAITAGEGKLINYGVARFYQTLRKLQQDALRKGYTMIFGQNPADAETGK